MCAAVERCWLIRRGVPNILELATRLQPVNVMSFLNTFESSEERVGQDH